MHAIHAGLVAVARAFFDMPQAVGREILRHDVEEPAPEGEVEDILVMPGPDAQQLQPLRRILPILQDQNIAHLHLVD